MYLRKKRKPQWGYSDKGKNEERKYAGLPCSRSGVPSHCPEALYHCPELVHGCSGVPIIVRRYCSLFSHAGARLQRVTLFAYQYKSAT